MTKRLECEVCAIYERDPDQPRQRGKNPKTGRPLFRCTRQLLRHLEREHGMKAPKMIATLNQKLRGER